MVFFNQFDLVLKLKWLQNNILIYYDYDYVCDGLKQRFYILYIFDHWWWYVMKK